MNKTTKRKMLFCEPCGFKRIVEVEEVITDLPECKTTPIQLKLPTLDPATNKTIPSKFQPQAKKYKCPQCGRGVRLRELMKPLADALAKNDLTLLKEEEQKRREERLEDGKPHEKKQFELDMNGPAEQGTEFSG